MRGARCAPVFHGVQRRIVVRKEDHARRAPPCGSGSSRRRASVTTPSVPSDPTNRSTQSMPGPQQIAGRVLGDVGQRDRARVEIDRLRRGRHSQHAAVGQHHAQALHPAPRRRRTGSCATRWHWWRCCRRSTPPVSVGIGRIELAAALRRRVQVAQQHAGARDGVARVHFEPR